jgi:hypothetical protein
MTKKDYELIAKVIKDDEYLWKAIHSGAMGREYQSSIAEAFAKVLRIENPRFNKDKFLVACGITK